MSTNRTTLRKIGLTTLGVLAVGAAALTLSGFAHGFHGRDPARMQRLVTARVEDALDDLQATPEQRERILALKDGLLASAQAARGDHAALAREVLAQWESPDPDRAQAHALVDERLDAMRAVAHQAVDAALAAHDTLTPAQREQVARKLRRHVHE
jgi:Spy/CpxP family protein refolding chaperone